MQALPNTIRLKEAYNTQFVSNRLLGDEHPHTMTAGFTTRPGLPVLKFTTNT
jgi:hypothetical protein